MTEWYSGLAHTRDAAELVLDGAGDTRQGVRFELADADQPIAGHDALGNLEFVDEVAFGEGYFARGGEVGQLDAQFLGNGQVA